MQEEVKGTSKLRSIDIAILVPVITVLCYGFSVIYSLGYLSYFQAPTFLIELSTFNITRSVMMMIPLIGVSVTPLLALFIVKNRVIQGDYKPRTKNYKRLMWPFVISFVVSSVYLIGILFIIQIIIFIALPFLTLFAYKRFLAKDYLFLPIIVFLWLFLIPFGTGYLEALVDKSFFIAKKDNKTYVAIHNSDKYLILAPVDLKKKEITPEYIVNKVEWSENNQLKFKKVETGRLHIKK